MIFKLTLSALLLVSSVSYGQTATEQLQKGIYAQETAGDLDGAIAIYRQIVGSTFGQRDVAAQAQYRLAETLLKKGDVLNAALEFQNLSRDYADYQALISKLANRFPPPPPSALPRGEFDLNRPLTLTGTVKQVNFMNPAAWLRLDAGGTEFMVALAAPNALFNLGWTADVVKSLSGAQITITGVLAKDGSNTAMASTVTRYDGRRIFDRADPTANLVAEQQFAAAQRDLEVLDKVKKAIALEAAKKK